MQQVLVWSRSLRIGVRQIEFLVLAILLAVAYATLAVVHNPLGWLVLVVGIVGASVRLRREALIYYYIVAVSLVALYLTPISAGNSPLNVAVSLFALATALAIPYASSHVMFKHSLIHLAVDFRRRWARPEWIMFAVSIGISVTFLGLFFLTGDAYKHWKLDTTYDVIVTFALIMLIGIWEEFYFIASVFGVLKKFLPAVYASALQAMMFSGFLFQFGFQGWIIPFTFIYAFAQGLTFYKFRNLALNISIHFTVDLAVFVLLMVRLHIG